MTKNDAEHLANWLRLNRPDVRVDGVGRYLDSRNWVTVIA